jgi:hypothetical protein
MISNEKKLNYKVIDLDENYNFHKKFTLIWDHTKKLRFFKMKWLISPCGMTIGGANVPHMCIVHNCCVVRWLEYGSTSNHCMIRIRWLDPNAIWYDSWSIVLQEFSKIECLIEKKMKIKNHLSKFRVNLSIGLLYACVDDRDLSQKWKRCIPNRHKYDRRQNCSANL